MRCKVFLIANSDGVVRMTRRWPALNREEIAVAVTVTIPDEAFRSPILSAELHVRDNQTIQPSVEVEVSE